MKRKVILISGLLICSIFVVGQSKTFKPQYKSNLIVIEKRDTATQFFLDYTKHLLALGFSIEKIDKDLLTLTTDFKTTHYGYVVKIVVFARQNGEIAKLEIRGKTIGSSPMGLLVPFDVCNCGIRGLGLKDSFEEILRTLENFDFEKIEFFKK